MGMHVYRRTTSQICSSKDICLHDTRLAYALYVTQYGGVAMRHATITVDMHNVRTKGHGLGNFRDFLDDWNTNFVALVFCRPSLLQSPYHYFMTCRLCYLGAIQEKSWCTAITKFVYYEQNFHCGIHLSRLSLLRIATKQNTALITLLAVIHQSIVESEQILCRLRNSVHDAGMRPAK